MGGNSVTCFQVPRGKVHRLVAGDIVRFPLGRAQCAPFERRPGDALLEPNDVPQKGFCRLCL